MVRPHWRHWLPIALIPIAAACGSSLRSQAHAVTASGGAFAHDVSIPVLDPSLAVLEQAAVEDPVVTLIAASDRHFKAGQIELQQGHFEAAKQEFNKAIDILLESPDGARTEPRIRDQFDRLVDRISAYEVRALAVGDGFTEKKYEPASIDELLALSTTFGTPAADPELKDTVKADPAHHDIPIPLNQRVLSYIELFQGRL